jgi:hypothetical protein
MTNYRSLDLSNTKVMCTLMALDTDLREFYYLCLEQGPFFKLIFDEFVTDAHSKRLQQAPVGLPACRPHTSHFARDYWKPQIEKSQISDIQKIFTKFQVEWHTLFSRFNAKFYFPKAAESVPSPWTALNAPLMTLATNICTICSELTGAQDMFLATNHDVPNPDEVAKFTVTYRKPARAPLDALLLSMCDFILVTVSAVPEPTTYAMLGASALIGCSIAWRRRRESRFADSHEG